MSARVAITTATTDSSDADSSTTLPTAPPLPNNGLQVAVEATIPSASTKYLVGQPAEPLVDNQEDTDMPALPIRVQVPVTDEDSFSPEPAITKIKPLPIVRRQSTKARRLENVEDSLRLQEERRRSSVNHLSMMDPSHATVVYSPRGITEEPLTHRTPPSRARNWTRICSVM